MCVDCGVDRVIAAAARMPNFHSLHAKIEVTLETFLPSPTVQQFSFRNFKGITGEQFNGCLNECDWTACLRDGQSPNILGCITDNLRSAIEELAPQKTVRPKKKNLHGSIRSCSY